MQITTQSAVKAIVKGYFVLALGISSVHAVESAHRAGLVGWEAWMVPLMVDGMALLGFIMRGQKFASDTRRLGLRVQAIMGVVQLVCNVGAAHSWGGIVFGIAVVTLYVAAEWLSDKVRGREAEDAELAAQRRSEASRKAAATRKASAEVKTRRQKMHRVS
jgi:hypothetical protein